MKKILESGFIILVFISYVGSIPLAFIFGTKLDVVLALIIPTYGFWVMLGALAIGN